MQAGSQNDEFGVLRNSQGGANTDLFTFLGVCTRLGSHELYADVSTLDLAGRLRNYCRITWHSSGSWPRPLSAALGMWNILMSWEITSSPSQLDESVVSSGVFDHGRLLASDGNAQTLACFLRKDGEVVAGGLGRTEYKRLFITSVWVTEHLRGQGIGSALISRMEQEALARECQDALIETLLEPNVRLYERLGYRSLARIPQYIGDFTRHIMVKSLTE